MIAAAPVPALEFRAVGHAYPGGGAVLAGVELAVPPGQFCVLLGASGAGKSTLLRAVAGLVRTTGGTVLVEGRPVTPRSLPEIRRRIGLVHQCGNLVGRLSVLDNICSGAVATLPWWRVQGKSFARSLQRRACHLLAEKYDVLIALHTDHCHPAKVDGFLKPLLQASRERIAAGAFAGAMPTRTRFYAARGYSRKRPKTVRASNTAPSRRRTFLWWAEGCA